MNRMRQFRRSVYILARSRSQHDGDVVVSWSIAVTMSRISSFHRDTLD
ncbi:unnamed protein product [Gongylonema pulchrum]|uniref:Uncharacterized protein n=1 Tax=Gongylonema pulchrum TaxID=637853 RepID=A0A183DJ55_9BILA|nr:unnamed protein product [Gongylonema pulchrum]